MFIPFHYSHARTQKTLKSNCIQDFKENKLDAEGNSLEPNELEQLTPEQAESLALQTGSDIFTGGAPYSKTFALKIPIGKR